MMDIKRGGKQVKDSMFNYGKDTCVSNSMAHTGVLSIRHKNHIKCLYGAVNGIMAAYTNLLLPFFSFFLQIVTSARQFFTHSLLFSHIFHTSIKIHCAKFGAKRGGEGIVRFLQIFNQ